MTTPAAHPVGPDEVRCPKCRLVQRPAPACPRCGLLAERFASFTPPALEPPPPALTAAWEAVCNTWDDPARHEAFVALASLVRRLDYAAACYRELDGPEAEAGLARIRSLAAAAMLAAATPRPSPGEAPKAGLGTKGAVVIVIVLVVGAILTWTLLRSAKRPGTPVSSLRSTPGSL